MIWKRLNQRLRGAPDQALTVALVAAAAVALAVAFLAPPAVKAAVAAWIIAP